ncbi:hypothetical protein ZEAMMB73_Zm00001d014172 [Zea mays]|uniref:Uncharacterized protein n=3 Tax=Zea mays TaxID=4577 RepID=A0A1D6GQK1_MAIZE|nr:hypothetical protein ZEAMMB73_Zm00001d014172 [Zea mays]
MEEKYVPCLTSVLVFFVLQFIFAFSLYCCILHKHLCLKFLEMYNDSLDALFLGAPTFKGRKQIENRRVVELGGKSVKKHRTPLSVAKPALKNQKKREQKKMEEEKLLGIFRKRDKDTKPHKTRPEDRVLRSTEGRFRNSILNVKHLLAPPKPSGKDMSEPKMRKDKHKGKGKQKGGRRKRR